MNWENIKVFVEIARCGSIKQAAKALGVNHSTVLRRINSLEEELNLQLFRRLQGGYEITVQGERILETALIMDRDAAALQRQALAGEETLQGPLHIACMPNDFIDMLPSLMAFHQQYPDIELNVESGAELRNLDVLEADVLIRLSNDPPEHYVGKQVLAIPFFIYGSKNYIEQHPALKTNMSGEPLEKLAEASWIVQDLPAIRPSLLEWLQSMNPDVKVAMNFSSNNM